MSLPPLDVSTLVPYTLAYSNQCWHEAMCWRSALQGLENCEWHVSGVDKHFHCGLERDTQQQVWRYLPADSVVLEVGSRYGTVSCTILKRQSYSGLRVSVEPDLFAFETFLQPNVRTNRCAGVQIHGVVSSSRAAFSHGSGYGGAATAAANGTVPGHSINWLESQLQHRTAFTALFLDCEGCALAFLNEHASFVRRPTLQHIFLELDQNQADLPQVLRLLCAAGFMLLASDPNLTCCPRILHLVFQRDSSRVVDRAEKGACASMLALSAAFEKRARWVTEVVEEHQKLSDFAGRIFTQPQPLPASERGRIREKAVDGKI